MKKKSLTPTKKLTLSKITVSALSAGQQSPLPAGELNEAALPTLMICSPLCPATLVTCRCQ
ncbi:class I lanthipeptide [Chitinophaga nivalis]|uniref:Class I lanthipeptide n=1 Tax=Chitinophaga nivalis TaxID=2991709 RepID=A0ABT3ILC7_9BACT|nr:class I lanthipeptide [Chitinophaga nivalis]MCW3465571.1 class I lanthipeptide [Chitinophaga nivalis]MCW3484738.1 class I lanthipeptide [Chitinophaga nivalis]